VVVVREVRIDPLTGEAVVLSSDRLVERRPAIGFDLPPSECPFCPGNEPHTRPTIAAIERDGRWVARAFANRWPALVVEEPLRGAVDGPYESVSGTGAHEVVVEAPEHAPLHELPVERSHDALALGVARVRDLRNDVRLRVVQWFRNHGTGAGASQPHPHAQVVGLPVIPRRVVALVERSVRWREQHGQPLLTAILEAERRDRRRLLLEDSAVTVFCPFAPRHPYEVWLVPNAPTATFGEATADQIRSVAAGMHAVSRALVAALGEVPMTTIALGSPHHPVAPAVGWHVRLAPRLVVGAGLEEATGASVHSVFPEKAAHVLRTALASG
jgi:UDPglucose--hexose-1-phosphate uridylyltransferase